MRSTFSLSVFIGRRLPSMPGQHVAHVERRVRLLVLITGQGVPEGATDRIRTCLLYTSDADDDLLWVDLGGRRSIQKKKRQQIKPA